MGVITDLHNRIQTLVDSSAIATLVYDRIDAINEDAKNLYPLMLYRVTETNTENYRNKRETFSIKIDFFISDLHFQGSSMTIQEKQDELDNLLSTILKSIPTPLDNNNFQLQNTSNALFGWEQHNDDLVVVKRTVTIQGFNCNTIIGQ